MTSSWGRAALPAKLSCEVAFLEAVLERLDDDAEALLVLRRGDRFCAGALCDEDGPSPESGAGACSCPAAGSDCDCGCIVGAGC